MPKTKQMCHGCRDDFYNGKNDLGVTECWGYKTAKIVTRVRVGPWQPPPYANNPQKTLSCHHMEGLCWLSVDDVRVLRKGQTAEQWEQEVSRA